MQNYEILIWVFIFETFCIWGPLKSVEGHEEFSEYSSFFELNEGDTFKNLLNV